MESPQTVSGSSVASVAALTEGSLAYNVFPPDTPPLDHVPYHSSLAAFRDTPSGLAGNLMPIPRAAAARVPQASPVHFARDGSSPSFASPSMSSEVSLLSPQSVPDVASHSVTSRRRGNHDPLGMRSSESVFVGAAASLPRQRATRRQTRASLKAGDEASTTPVTRPVRKTRTRKRKASQMSPPPNAKDPPKEATLAAGAKKKDTDENDTSCCICMCEPESLEKASINGCHHIFCFGCIEQWADRENTCPLCKVRFSKIDRVNKCPRKKGTRSNKNTKRVKNRDQRSDLAQGNPLQGFLASMESGDGPFPATQIARLVFGGLPELAATAPSMGFAGRRAVRWAPAGFVPPPPQAARRSSAEATAAPSGYRRAATAGDSSEFDLDFPDSSDEAGSDEEAFDSFVERVRNINRRVDNLGFRVDNITRELIDTSAAFRMPHYYAPANPPRSYATNMHDVDAGETAENALEIESDSDDEVEVVRVSRADSL